MEATPLSARLGLWRLTRHPVTRRLYDTVERTGVFVAQLDRFERSTVASIEDTDLPADALDPPADVELSTSTLDEALPERLADEPVAPDDTVVVATRDGERVGSCCLSDRPVYVPELHRRLTFGGTYLWKLYVTPSERGQGIGSAIIAHAIAESPVKNVPENAPESTTRTDRIVALVAPDNLPSRRAFHGLGFRPTERFTSVGWGRLGYHRQRPL